MLNCDVLGFDHLRYFKREGNEFPVPFEMKHLSRVGLSCRNPIMTGFLFIFITPLFYGSVSLGRLVFSGIWAVSVVLGTIFEEIELRRSLGKAH